MGSRHRDIFRTVVLLASMLAQKKICLPFSLFALLVRPLAKKYHVKDIYLFVSYVRDEADAQKVDIFEICEVNPDSDFYHTIMKEKVLVA